MAPPPVPNGQGGKGLATSQHAEPPAPEMENVKKLVDGLVSMANPEAKGTARGMGQDLLAAVYKIHNAFQSQTGNISLANLRKVVAEEIKAAVGGNQGKKSWTAVAAQETQVQTTPPTKAVPSRINKEILIKGKGMPADLADRTPQEIIQAVNQVSTKKGAIAARKLPSGDTIITFNEVASRDWHSTNSQWVKESFGLQAEESKRTFAILLKGVWKGDLQGATEEVFGKETGLQTIDKVKFRVRKHQTATRA